MARGLCSACGPRSHPAAALPSAHVHGLQRAPLPCCPCLSPSSRLILATQGICPACRGWVWRGAVLAWEGWTAGEERMVHGGGAQVLLSAPPAPAIARTPSACTLASSSRRFPGSLSEASAMATVARSKPRGTSGPPVAPKKVRQGATAGACGLIMGGASPPPPPRALPQIIDSIKEATGASEDDISASERRWRRGGP